jgi:acyl-CoA synthetase (AMP-forming)/AMP-acid ligase II
MDSFTSLVDILEMRAAKSPDRRAYAFLSERGVIESELSYSDLYDHACAAANDIFARGGRFGDRALLVFPPGLDFLVGLFGCLIAGIVAVPMPQPRRTSKRDASANIVADCMPKFALTSEAFASSVRDDVITRFAGHGLEWVILGDTKARLDESVGTRPSRGTLALLQYTSGSTASPKGVMVSHANLLDNLEMIRRAFGNTGTSNYVSWVPLHHDMGLVLNVLEAFYVGAPCVLMAPVAFLQRPLSWLKAIHDMRAEVAGAPNFAYDLCVSRFRPEGMTDIDLSGWRVAFNGAEPVRAETLERFATTFEPYGFNRRALYPCYGMAEATLLITGGTRDRGPVVAEVNRRAMQALRMEPAKADENDAIKIVGCGKALAGEDIAIVDPETRQRLGFGHIGEIWVRGANVSRGYWKNATESLVTFGGQIVGEAGPPWLRTGDLGCFDPEGELFVTGRIKDLIIVRGVNHYPQDIEHTVQSTDACLRAGFGAAFAGAGPQGQESVIVVQEIERVHRHRADLAEIAASIREAVADEHELSVHDIVFVRPGTIPKTTSGKIQRRLTRRLWEEGALEVIPSRARNAPDQP